MKSKTGRQRMTDELKAKRIEHWDDERSIENGIIVTLHWGWSFENGYHAGVKGFDTIKDAMFDVRCAYECVCGECREMIALQKKFDGLRSKT